MGLFGAISAGLFRKKGKGGGQSDTSKPFHTHSKKAENNTNAVASSNAGGSPPPSNTPADLPQPSFMGKNQDETFGSLTNPKAELDRGGRTVTKPEGVDPVGIEPAMNPPMAVPTQTNIDDEGVNSLYS